MTQLVLIRAADDAALVAELDRVVGFLDRVPGVSLVDVACTCSKSVGDARIAVIAEDVSSLRTRLASARDRIAAGVPRIQDKSGTYYYREPLLGKGGGRLAFVYAGVLGFYPNMMVELAVASADYRRAFDELEEALSTGDGEFTPSNFVFPPAPCYKRDAEVFAAGGYAEALVSTFASCMALSKILDLDGIVPDGVVGFGGGDLAAMVKSGATRAADARLTRAERLDLLRDIYRLVDRAVDHSGIPPANLVTVIMRHEGDAEAVVASFPPEKCVLAVDFSPRQRTYAIEPDFLETALAAFHAAGVRTSTLPFDRPFNTPKCAMLTAAIHKFAAKWIRGPAVRDVYCPTTAGRFTRSLKAARDEAAEMWAQPVRFRQTVERMYEDGYRVFLEVGPRGLMTSAVQDTLKGRDFAAMAINSTHRSDILQSQHAIAQLLALGQEANFERWYPDKLKPLDFDGAFALEEKRDTAMRLSRVFPKMTLLGSEELFGGESPLGELRGSAKRAQRAAARAEGERKLRQLQYGTRNPMMNDAERLEESPGVSLSLRKEFSFAANPFLADFALGTSQVSYSDPNLRGLVLFTLPVGIELMAETAQMLAPNFTVLSVEDVSCHSNLEFPRDGRLSLRFRAERVACTVPGLCAVRVRIRPDADANEMTMSAMEATVYLGDGALRQPEVNRAPVLATPRKVHWSGRDIYPTRICFGKRLRNIDFVESWASTGLDYTVKVPPLAGNVVYTRFPQWIINPILLGSVTSGFTIWRSHERFAGAFSLPFHVRSLHLFGPIPKEGTILNCYLRLTGVTAKSLLCDITVTTGDGNAVMRIDGWEELAQRVPPSFRDILMQPGNSFLTRSLPPEVVGMPGTDFSTAFVSEPPYEAFRDHPLWFHALSRVVLDNYEYSELLSRDKIPLATNVEWVYGRVVAKEAVRRFLKDFYQSRWSNADVNYSRDPRGKPVLSGDWQNFLTTSFDVAISHTGKFIVGLAAANHRVGIDVESARRDLSDGFAERAFNDDERDLAALGSDATPTIIRFWCAKEALSKALGTGIKFDPRQMRITAYDPGSGRITMRLTGDWEKEFTVFKDRDIVVTSAVHSDHVLAFAFIPTNLLPLPRREVF